MACGDAIAGMVGVGMAPMGHWSLHALYHTGCPVSMFVTKLLFFTVARLGEFDENCRFQGDFSAHCRQGAGKAAAGSHWPAGAAPQVVQECGLPPLT